MSNFSSAHDFDQVHKQVNRPEEIDAYLSESSTFTSFNSGFAHHIQRNQASQLNGHQKQDSNFTKSSLVDLNLQYQRDQEKFLGTWKTDHYTVMRITREYIVVNAFDHISLYMTKLEPINQKFISQMVIVHGFGEHQGRYINIADSFARNGIKVILYDQRGFGRSGGIRGGSTIKQMHEDFESILMQLDRQIPVFIYCHALGAAIVLSFCIVNPQINFNGIITSNAYLRLDSSKYSKLKRILLRLMNKTIPDVKINHYIDFSHQSKNNYHIKKSVEDPLMQHFLTVQMAYNVMQLCDFILPNCSNFTTPINLMHGKQDRVSNYMNSLDFYRLAGSKEKSMKIFEFGFHELHNDCEGGRMAKMIVTWCKKLVDTDKRITSIRNINYGIEKYKQVKKQSSQKLYFLSVIFILIMIKRLFQNQINYFIRKSNCLKYLSTYWIKFLSKCLMKLFL